MDGRSHPRYAVLAAVVAGLAAAAVAETPQRVDLAQAVTGGTTPGAATITSCPPGTTPTRVRPVPGTAGAASGGSTSDDTTALESTICVRRMPPDADTGTSGYTGAPSTPATPSSPDSATRMPDARDRALR